MNFGSTIFQEIKRWGSGSDLQSGGINAESMVSKINNPFSANIKEGGLALRSLFGGLDSSLAYSVTFSESGCAEDFAEPGIVVQGHHPKSKIFSYVKVSTHTARLPYEPKTKKSESTESAKV